MGIRQWSFQLSCHAYPPPHLRKLRCNAVAWHGGGGECRFGSLLGVWGSWGRVGQSWGRWGGPGVVLRGLGVVFEGSVKWMEKHGRPCKCGNLSCRRLGMKDVEGKNMF